MDFTAAPSNFSSPEHLLSSVWISRGLIPAVVLSICLMLGVPGNIAVILLKPNWKKMSSLSRSLMLNLAISDLICLLTLPPWIYNLLHSWIFGVLSCKLLSGIVYCSVYGSQLTVTAVSVQRYLVVVHRIDCKRVPKRVLLGLLWLVALLLSVPTFVVRQVKTDPILKRCKPDYSTDARRVALLLSEATVGFASLSLVAFTYISLQRKVTHGALFKNRQTTRLVTCIIVCFFVLWVPYHVINLLGVAAICLQNDILLKFCRTAWNVTGALSFVNSCINPLLYAFTSEKVCTVCRKDPEQQNSRNLRTADMSSTSEP
ncbi:leukotriene B4 receptor 1-like [Poecilia reticulata]|uniref:leukotriene B4 receptor 1-like n=1 Tax=Poecilia reticulata TaxID=8081 RepID=UPI0004A2B083|nr:PREDICTED: leukotriene B4 receptor 1-like [Poecilia reticulata]